MNKNRAARIAVALFFAVLMIIGLCACGDYSLFSPGEACAVTELFEKMDPYVSSYGTQSERWQVFIWLWFMLGVAALYAFSRETGLGRPVSCLGALMMVLCPRLFAQAHHDASIALLSVVLWVLWLTLRLLRRPGVLRGVLLAAAIALFVWILPAPAGSDETLIAKLMITTLPLYVLPLAGLGQLAVCRRIWEQRRGIVRDPATLLLIAASLCWFLPIVLFARASDTLACAFVYAGLLVLAVHGISGMYRFGRHFGGDCGMHVVLLAGLVLFFGWTARDMARNHPYQYVYYNRLGHAAAMQELTAEEEKASAALALQKLLQSGERNARYRLVVGSYENESLPGLQAGHEALTAEEQKQVRISGKKNTYYLYSCDSRAPAMPPEGYHELFRLQSYGLPLCTVYEKD